MLTYARMTIEEYDEAQAFWGRTEGMGLGPSDSRAGLAMFLARNPDLSWVVRDGATIVGTVLVGHDGRRGFLHHLAVEPAYRGQQIGRALVDRALEGLAACGIIKVNAFVYRTNASALRFWEAMGWSDRPDLTLMQVLLPPE